MSDEDAPSKTPTAPSWQQSERNTEGRPSHQQAAGDDTAAATKTTSPERGTVIEQAKKFLEEDEVKNSSTDKKVSFLESKGLRGDEIEELLGIRRNLEASSTNSPAIMVSLPADENWSLHLVLVYSVQVV